MTPTPPTLSRVAALVANPAPPVQHVGEREFPTSLVLIRKLLWVYLFLWVTEGALRKWVLPGLATPLLVVRDPLLLVLFYLAIKEGVFPRGVFVVSVIVLGLIAFLVSTAATDTAMFIQLYGLRASYLHLLLIFLIPNVFDREDVLRVGRWTLLLAAPMAGLVMAQFAAGKGSWLNAGAGGSNNAMIESAFGHIRPAGTFSFTTGLTGFSAMAAVFVLYQVLEKRVYPRKLWLVAVPAVLVLIMLSGSRTAAGTIFLIMSTMAFISVVQRRYRAAAIKLGALLGVLVAAGGSFAVFQQGVAVFAYRFGNAADVRTGFVGRFFETVMAPFGIVDQAPTFGWGLGMGTNVAAGLLYGYGVITLSEGEPGRNIMESGPLIGGTYLVLRACIAVYLGLRALGSLRRDANPLPLLIYSGCCIDVLMGQFSQPTELGYATIAGGLCLAANRLGTPAAVPTGEAVPVREPRDPVRPTKPAPIVPEPAAVRGRSAYAERMHGAASVSAPENPPESPI